MKLRSGKHWGLIIDNTAPCTDCDKVTAIAMRGNTAQNERELLCKACALRRGDMERQILTSLKVLLRYVRGHLTSLIVILILNIVITAGIATFIIHRSYNQDVELITEWAYPKASPLLSKSKVRYQVEAHKQYSKRWEHTLAILMAEGRFRSEIVGEKYEGMIGGGQISWFWWGKKLIEAGICTEKRDLFDPVVTARAMSFILDHYLSLLPTDLRVPGIRLTYALTMYVGHAEGKIVLKGLSDRNTSLSNDELREIISKLSYPVEVLAYAGEILEVERNGRKIISQGRPYISPILDGLVEEPPQAAKTMKGQGGK
jgi:hypothetical protein